MKTDSGLMLIGVGGGGCRLAATAFVMHGEGMRALGIDTDSVAIHGVSGLRCLLIGQARLDGHGTGGDVIKGRQAALDDIEILRREMDGVRTVVLATCLGGGTGAGVTPELLRIFRDMGIVTLCFVTRPFEFEDAVRRQAAQRSLPMFEENADTLVVVPLDELHAQTGIERVAAAHEAAAWLLGEGLTLLWRILLTPGFVRLDPIRLRGMLLRGKTARLGLAVATGSDRAAELVARLRHAPLLRGDALGRARALALGVLAGADLRLAELDILMRQIQAACQRECHIEMGTVLDPRYEGRIELVALVFENWVASENGAHSDVAPADVANLLSEGALGARSKTAKGAKLRRNPGRFRGVEPTIHAGESLDIPTYLRRKIVLER